jgi:tetratricopeptide (TPR) repeat protein
MLLLIPFVLAAMLPACPLPKLPAQRSVPTPLELVVTGHDLRAKAILTPIVEADPDDAEAALLLSKALQGLGELDAALKLAEKTVEIDSGNADYHVQLGTVLGRMAEKASIFKQLGLARRAKKELDLALSLDPKNLDALYGEMMYLNDAPSFIGGDKAKAAQFAAAIGAINPARGWIAKASLAHEKKDAETELDFALRAVAADPREFDTHAAAAQALLLQDEPDYAAIEQTGCKMLELDPYRLDGWRLLAEVMVANHDWAGLDKLLETAARFNPEDLSPYYTAAAAMLLKGERLPEAQAYIEKYLSQPPDGSAPTLAAARVTLAEILEKEQRFEDAAAQLELALQADPGLEEARKDLKRLKGR